MLQTTAEWKIHWFSFFDFIWSRICSAVIHNYGLTNTVLCKPPWDICRHDFRDISDRQLKVTSHYYRHCLRHHYISISQDPCSCLQPANPLSSCHLLYSLSLFKSSSTIYVTVGCELSWPDVWLQSVTMGQGGATVHSVQKQRGGVSQGVKERWRGVGGVVSRWEKG